MTIEEQEIWESAKRHCLYDRGVCEDDDRLCNLSEQMFVLGAKSPEAKAFHTKGMYSEAEEVRKIVVKVWEHAYNLGTCEFKDLKPKVIRDPLVWFEQNKKK